MVAESALANCHDAQLIARIPFSQEEAPLHPAVGGIRTLSTVSKDLHFPNALYASRHR